MRFRSESYAPPAAGSRLTSPVMRCRIRCPARRWSSPPGPNFAARNGSTKSRTRGRSRHKAEIHVGPVAIGEPGAKLGSHVAIIGGGDNAFDVASILLRKGIKVTIVMRASAPHAQPRLIAQARAHGSSGSAEVLADRSVEALMDAGNTIRLRLNDGTTFEADQVVLLLGYRPNSHEPWLTELALGQSGDGHLVVGGNMETTCPGLFAVGDVANPVHPCVATALAGGTMAAREIAKRLA